MKHRSSYGKLFLIPAPVSPGALSSLSPESIQVIHRTYYYIVENARSARRFIRSTGPPYALDVLSILELDKHREQDIERLLAPLVEGHDMGVISEAGCPGIADPGSVIVAHAHKKGIKVIPLAGPSSILLALMASGMNGQHFQFHGYLTPKRDQITAELRRLEETSKTTGATQIFIEAPYRNSQILKTAFSVLAPTTQFCIAADMTAETEWIHTETIADWKASDLPDLHRRPCVFCLLAG